MVHNNTTKWSEGHCFVQFMKNRRFHCRIKNSSYEALFHHNLKVGFEAHSLLDTILTTLCTEEEVQRVLPDECSDESAPSVSDSNTHDKDIPKLTANAYNALELDLYVAQSTSTSDMCECFSYGCEIQSG